MLHFFTPFLFLLLIFFSHALLLERDWRYTNCGRCFEIKCREGPRYNCRGDRLNASLIVMVTDKCPCNRWCCGDEPHFDLSFWGFGEIGNHGGGVISTSWRPIECPENMGKGGELVLNPQEYEVRHHQAPESFGVTPKRCVFLSLTISLAVLPDLPATISPFARKMMRRISWRWLRRTRI